MKILFIDETDRQANAQKRLFFCICGLVVDDSEIIALTAELEEIKKSYGLSNLKESRKTGLSKEVRIAITTAVSNSLQSHSAKVIGIVLGDFSMSFELPADDMYIGALSFLMERYALILRKENDTGLVVFDCLDKTLEKKVREKFYTYIQETSLQMYWMPKPLGQMRDYIIPTLHFVDDQESILIQAVDLIATSLNAAIVKSSKKGFSVVISDLPDNNEFLKIYWPLFVRSPKGKIGGWGIKVWD